MIPTHVIALIIYAAGFVASLKVIGEVVLGVVEDRGKFKRRLLERQWELEDRRALEGSVSLLLTNRELATTVRDKITVALRDERKQLPAAETGITVLEGPVPRALPQRKPRTRKR